jgi:hypothetical protein
VWNCNIWHWTRNSLAPHKPYDDDEDKMVRLALLAWMTVLERQLNSVLALSS